MRNRILILITFFMSINTSVFTEDKKEIGNSPYLNLSALNQKLLKYEIELKDIRTEFFKMMEKSIEENNKSELHKQELTYQLIGFVLENMDKIYDQNDHFETVLYYEELFLNEKINQKDNRTLLVRHSLKRSSVLSELKRRVSRYGEESKKLKIRIQNVSAVLCINNFLEVIDELNKLIAKDLVFDSKKFIKN